MARRQRKRHVQLDMLNREGTKAKGKRALSGKRRKGRKPGRRPKNGQRAGTPHSTRPYFSPTVPLHVVLKVDKLVGSLRKREMYKALRTASIVAARHRDVRIIHISIQCSHIHLLVEANDRRALSKGMRAFQISAAKHINRALSVDGQPRRKGQVFVDRYFVELISNRAQAHRALNYVLNNWRKHQEDAVDERANRWYVDPFSTGILFPDWQERDLIPQWRDYEPLVVSEPQTWLLRAGWKLYGPLSCLDIPSAPIVSSHS